MSIINSYLLLICVTTTPLLSLSLSRYLDNSRDLLGLLSP
nr:MAG TPA: hypothetical protein [Caudoviricetes sp.]